MSSLHLEGLNLNFMKIVGCEFQGAQSSIPKGSGHLDVVLSHWLSSSHCFEGTVVIFQNISNCSISDTAAHPGA
jgi:hypothetical protein